jgi:hypothetical protein
LARSHTNLAIKVLAGIAKDGTNDGARVAAAVALLDRGWGKPAQAHTDKDDKEISITIRQLFEHRDEEEPLLLEHEPLGK